jgi:peptidoglycan glycosyltransferase
MFSLAIVSGIWSVTRADELNTYPSNPRPILQEARIRRGNILDRNGNILASISVGPAGYVERTYPVPEAAPVVGYASIEYGTEGIESICDARLRGDIDRSDWDRSIDRILHQELSGQDIRLTIDAELQSLAQERMQGLEGAAVLIDSRTGEILVMASSPTYAPGSVAEDWESLRSADDAPLLNRATQGLTQPGMILAPIILEEAWVQGFAALPPQPLTSTIQVNGDTIGCARDPETTSWRSALASQCPAPLAQIGKELGAERVSDAFATWGLTDAPQFALPTVSSEYDPNSTNAMEESIGQGSLLVTPLQAVGVMATLANDGQRTAFQLINGPAQGCDVVDTHNDRQVITAENAARLVDTLPQYDQSIGLLVHALAGSTRVQSWFLGLNSEQVPRYAVAVLISQTEPSNEVVEIGELLLRQMTKEPETNP